MSPQANDFDLQPDPRVLQMLGEIDLEPWRCIAELIDNGIDGFLHASRSGAPIDNPEIRVTLPNRDDEAAKVQIFDNGPGMDADGLERAVRAGYSGNNPTDNLGLFGMGFNIATARLGATTTVWSTRAGDDVVHGVRIDFADLRARKSFRTPHLTQSKTDKSQHFTRIEISTLKPDQRKFLAASNNQRTIRTMLAKSYASMLRQGGEPIRFSLRVNDVDLKGRRHCVWGEDRAVEVPGVGRIHAFTPINHRLIVDSVSCSHCLSVMLATDLEADGGCLTCGRSDGLVRRERRIRGWIGLQRYLHTSDFGLDFIRNGRKIEMSSKELFLWEDEAGGASIEYPVDDQRNRGRIVGEIHLDHCPVDFSKRRFDRSHRAWGEMVRFIRGDGPLLPQKAQSLGYTSNDSILFNFVKAFRRSSPAGAAGGWQRIIAVPDNDQATQMAESFHQDLPDFRSDAKWWDLVVEGDQKRLTEATGTNTKQEDPKAAGARVAATVADIFGQTTSSAAVQPTTPPPPVRTPVPSMTQTYEFRSTKIEVQTFETLPADPDLLGAAPFRFMRRDSKSKDWHFIYDPTHRVFNSVSFSPLDALVTELSWHLQDVYRGAAGQTPAAVIVDGLRSKYAKSETLDLVTVSQDASQALRDLISALLFPLSADERNGLFDELSEREKGAVSAQLFKRSGKQQAFEDGTFLRFFPDLVTTLIERRPELFFDGAVWDIEHEKIDLKDPQATVEAQREIRERVKARVADAIWASNLEDVELSPTRNELLRAISAVRLLLPDRDYE